MIEIDVCWDECAGVYVATSKCLVGLVVEATTMHELILEIHAAANDLLSIV